MQKLTIYNDDINEYVTDNKQFIINSLNELELTINDENITAEAATMIDNDGDELKQMIMSYDKTNKYDCVLCVADLGLWYGRRKASKHFKTLYDAFYTCVYDTNKVYFNKANQTLKLQACHHDGVNYYKFYKVINGKKYAINYNDFIN